MRQKLEKIRTDAEEAIQNASSERALEDVRIRFLGKKGELTAILKMMGGLSPEERPAMGQLANEVRAQIEEKLHAAAETVKQKELEQRLKLEKVDITMDGKRRELGRVHPLSATLEKLEEIFTGLGFTVVEGPEVETEYYNFEALNVPKDHPARDMQDTFYITEKFLLRTQTSPVQARTMQACEPDTPIRMIAPGTVYRNDYDATHSPMFHQVEGLVLGENISLADLKGTLETFCKEMFGGSVEIRLRPSYFPFTEPSAEVDISCVICGGKGCRVCKNSGWLEILGSGMVHPNVLRMSGYDPGKINGYAFGMGVERIAMLKYGIDDLRLFFENDLRFIRQFK